MARFLRHLLVLIALLGPLDHALAYAQPVTVASETTTSVQGNPGCKGMSLVPGIVKSMPCPDQPLDCIGKMGCLHTSLLPDRAVPQPRLIVWQLIHYLGVVTPATGLTVEPEVFPPIA